MTKSTRFPYKVTVKLHKGKSSPRITWCQDHIGDIGVNWSRNIVRSFSNDTKITFVFAYEKDATMFALKFV